MANSSAESLADKLELADLLAVGRSHMFVPQDLPGRYGRVVAAVDRVLEAIQSEAVVGGGWAVWRHGYVGRVTQDIDIVLPANKIEEFLRVAGVSGFHVLEVPPERWPKLQHKETGIEVDILPEGKTPGTPKNLAPTTIPHPERIGAEGTLLRYVELQPLVELKLAAGRAQDDADVIKLIQTNPSEVDRIAAHLSAVHAIYRDKFDRLVQRARDELE